MVNYEQPLGFYCAGDLEVALEHVDHAVGFQVNAGDKLFTASIDNGPFQTISNIRLGLTDELAREFIAALQTYSRLNNNHTKG